MGKSTEYKIENNQIIITEPFTPKKVTGTRFSNILRMNPWQTPFQTWCEITKVYTKPFEETKYTNAGKIIEPKQAEYIKNKYSLVGLTSPVDMFGPDYFKKTLGDFFPDEDIFGGAWDRIVVNEEGKITSVIEFKTSKNKNEWIENGVPASYELQAALYAYLCKTDKVVIVPTFLNKADYNEPEKFECNDTNTMIVPFKVSMKFPSFEEEYINKVKEWWKQYVEKGISPEPDLNDKGDSELFEKLKNECVDKNELLEKMKANRTDEMFY